MQRKQSAKGSYDKLQNRLSSALEAVNKLAETVPKPFYSAPDQSILKNLLAEAEDSYFWQNFKKAAPIMFCVAVEGDEGLKQMRDMSFIEELLKTKSILQLLNEKLESNAADVDIIEYSIATKMLEQKLAILTSLNVSVDGDGDEKASFNIFGTNKSIVIDKAKLREAITIQDTPVVEKMASSDADKEVEIAPVDMNLPEEEFLDKVVEAVGTLQKTEKKTLQKDSFIKVFKYMGDFNKIKTRELKKTAQQKRCDAFNEDSKVYLEALKAGIQEEEKAFEASSRIMFDKLCITQECFERSQQELMNDPYVSMQLFNMGVTMEQPNSKVPDELTNEKTIELVKASNNYAFEKFKTDFISCMSEDPMMAPIMISCIAHDWIFLNHKYPEEDFKSALFAHKIYENPEISRMLQEKQMELMMILAQNNPMMMQQMAMMGGGMPQGGMPPGGMPPGMGM